jgi:hypothetical protein
MRSGARETRGAKKKPSASGAERLKRFYSWPALMSSCDRFRHFWPDPETRRPAAGGTKAACNVAWGDGQITS